METEGKLPCTLAVAGKKKENRKTLYEYWTIFMGRGGSLGVEYFSPSSQSVGGEGSLRFQDPLLSRGKKGGKSLG